MPSFLDNTIPATYIRISGTFTADGTLLLPAGFQPTSTIVRETAGKSVRGDFQVGTDFGSGAGTIAGVTADANTVASYTGSGIKIIAGLSKTVDLPLYLGPIRKVITDITQANPAVVTCNAHGFLNGDLVTISGVIGMTEVNDIVFTVANKATNTFELSGIDSTAYTAYASAGKAVGWNGATCVVTVQAAQFD